MKRAAVYARVSTSDQVRGTSLDTQVEACNLYAQGLGHSVVATVRDDSSGAVLARPGLDKIRHLAEHGGVEVVIVHDPDRLSRNLGHLMLLIDEFARLRVELVFVNAPHENTAEGMMLLQMRGMFAQYERTKIQERSRRGKERRAKQGRVITSWAVPYGYTYVIGEGRMEVAAQEARIVRLIFDWYVNERKSLRAIAHRLNELGVPTKRGAKCWSPSTIRSILTNPVYGGTWFYNKNESAVAKHRRFADGRKPRREKSGQVKRPMEEWIGVSVPAIVSPNIYTEVTAQMARNARHAKRNCKAEYLLRGLLVCKQCGRRLTGRQSSTYKQYYCTGHYEENLRGACKCPWPNASKLDAQVWGKIAELLSDEDLITQTLESHHSQREVERAKEDAELATLYASGQGLHSEETRLLDAYAKGVIDLDQLSGRMEFIRQQKNALSQLATELRERVQQRETVRAREANIKRLVALAKQGLPLLSFEDKRAFLEDMGIQGIVDGVSGTLTLTGLIKEVFMPLGGCSSGTGGDGSQTSGQVEEPSRDGDTNPTLDLRTQHQRAVQRLRKRPAPAYHGLRYALDRCQI